MGARRRTAQFLLMEFAPVTLAAYTSDWNHPSPWDIVLAFAHDLGAQFVVVCLFVFLNEVFALVAPRSMPTHTPAQHAPLCDSDGGGVAVLPSRRSSRPQGKSVDPALRFTQPQPRTRTPSHRPHSPPPPQFDNILVEPHGSDRPRLLICDFGCATFLDADWKPVTNDRLVGGNMAHKVRVVRGGVHLWRGRPRIVCPFTMVSSFIPFTRLPRCSTAFATGRMA